MTNLKNKLQNKTAFSLIELSIVILIIGIIIAGVTQSSRLIKQFKLASARTQTQSGPVTSIKDLAAWFETTSTASFIDSEAEDSALSGGSAISYWYDINSTSSIKRDASNATVIARPNYYANCINGLPCLRFDGNNDSLLFDGTFLIGVDYTIFVVEQRRLGSANYFIGRSTSGSQNNAVDFGYFAATTFRFGQGSPVNFYTLTVANYSTPTAKLHTFVNSTIASNTPTFVYYMNGGTASTLSTVGGASTMGTLTAYDNATIGSSNTAGTPNYFTGDIGEIIFYSRALKIEERTSVEAYLLKKWGITKLP